MSAALDQLLHQMAHLDELAWNEETYDLGLARSLDGDERTTFIGKLMETSRQGDTHAILTLAHMTATEGLPMLQAEEGLADPEDAVRMLAWEGLVDVFDLRKLIRSPEGKAEMSTELELRRMTEALASCGGVQKRAAELIGMPVRTFTMKYKQYGLGEE